MAKEHATFGEAWQLLRSGLSWWLLGLAFDVAPAKEKTKLAFLLYTHAKTTIDADQKATDFQFTATFDRNASN